MELVTIIIYTSIYIGLVATTFYILTYISGAKKEEQFSDDELPKVSILIPAYNEEKTIEDTMKSALASDYPKEKFEVIVIDDGSTDKTCELAKNAIRELNNGIVTKVFSKKQGGKGSALNFGIKKTKGDFIFTMDADTFVAPQSLKNMTRYFKNDRVMCVSPAIIIHNPRNFLQRVQYIEYVLGLFLRKTFAILNAVHITPGAFSAYRKSFFEEYGGYDEGNITEDLEIAMRVQYHGYKIENSPESPVYTIAPSKFSHLLKQRRRWYVGLIKNIWDYKKLLTSQYGDLGVFVLPVALISIFFAVFVTVYFFFKTILDIGDEILFFKSINFDLGSLYDLNLFFFERLFFRLATNPILIFILFFLLIICFYLFYASRKIGKLSGFVINLALFFMLFAVLFGIWWIVSLVYIIFNKEVNWK